MSEESQEPKPLHVPLSPDMNDVVTTGKPAKAAPKKKAPAKKKAAPEA